MKTLLLSLLILVFNQSSFSQTNSEENLQSAKHGNLTSHLYEVMQLTGKDNIEHVDSLLNYRVTIPIWWKIKETPTRELFGGIFPAINGIENALLFKSFGKAEFNNVTAFEDWVVKSYKIGDVPKRSDGSHNVLLKKEIKDFSTLGKSYTVQLMRDNLIYKCCYVVVETPDTYLWIDFTATTETYDVNFPKLKDILSKFSVIR